MLIYEKPEKLGISNKSIEDYIKKLEDAELATHDIIIMRHGKVIYENYWAPFHENFLHRMYSVTKSFVALAVGFLLQDGKISLDDKIVDILPKDITEGAHEKMQQQTIRNMLMMSTGFPLEENGCWFLRKPKNRVRDYFEHSKGVGKTPGTMFAYDSTGSFILGAMVEQLSGTSLIEYLREKLFDKIGVSKEANFLLCPGGNAWADSGLLCTARDLLKVAQFTMNLGEWNGEQILDREYLKEATSCLISTNINGTHHTGSYGYGYLIWRQQQNSFFFNGMGCQFAICVPDKEIIFVYNGDNQGNPLAKSIIIDNFYDIIVNNASKHKLPENPVFEKNLKNYTKTLKLYHCKGKKETEFMKKINGKTYIMSENPMGIEKIKLTFDEKGGILEYTNLQGEKALPFGMTENVFSQFQQEGYSDQIGTIPAPGNYYDCAASAAWIEERKLHIEVQIIDKYFGRLFMVFSFPDENNLCVSMVKTAEYFLDEYNGYAEGVCEGIIEIKIL